MTEKLSAFELALLPKALEFARQNELTRDSLRKHLSCGCEVARNLQLHIEAQNMVKVAEHLEAIPVNAEARNETNLALGVPVGTAYGHILRENVNLKRALAKAQFKTEAEKEQRAQGIRAEIEELKVLAKEDLGVKPRKAEKPAPDSGLMLEIATPDLHAGKLCWPLETGGAPYDVKIAIATFDKAIDTLLERANSFKFDEILLCVGNDLYNSDNPEGTTTSGTSVSNDGRFHRTFRQVRTMLIRTIERLRTLSRVRVVCCPGNHDLQAAYHLADSLECYFHADQGVVVENAPVSRKYVQWGKCLIGFCHGHEERQEDLGLLMASEQPEKWAQTLFREWHLGHYHRLQTTEKHGIRVRVLPALCTQDDWHSIKGFVNNLRTAQAFVWSKNQGLIAEVFYNADADEPITTKTEII
jgi:hypothetical protein